MRIVLLTKAEGRQEAAPEEALMEYLRCRGHLVHSIAICAASLHARPHRTARALHQLSRLPTPEVVLALCDNPSAMVAACVMRLISEAGRRPRFFLWVGDLAGQRPYATAKTAEIAIRMADVLVVPGSRLQQEVRARLGQYEARRKVIISWPGLGVVRNAPDELRTRLGLKERFVVVHHGKADRGYDRAALSQAVELTRTDQSIAWVFVGCGPTSEQLRRGADAPANVVFLAPNEYSPEQLRGLGDVNLLTEGPENKNSSGPADIVPFLAEGKPTFAVCGKDSDWAHVMDTCGAGSAIASGHGEMLARAIWQLRDSSVQRDVLGKSARRAYETYFTPAAACARIEHILTGQI